MSLNIRELTPHHITEVFPLYREAFGADKLKIWEKRWRWEFLENPRTKFVHRKCGSQKMRQKLF